MRNDWLWTLFLVFLPLSMLSVGGGATIIAPLHHQAVETFHWLSEKEFVEVFAISRAAPGPGSMIVPLIGWKVAGVMGAIVASIGMFLPSSLLVYGVAKLWNRYRGTTVHTSLERGLAAVAAGLILASTLAIIQAAGTGWLSWVIAGLASAVLFWRNVNPLIVLFGGGALYAVGMNFLR
ncbi:MAG TPA: chromate transporter [Alphaproteobacteria bacterium]|jgi:chromate transporter